MLIYNLYYIYNVSPFLMRQNVFGYQKTNVVVLRHTVQEDRSV